VSYEHYLSTIVNIFSKKTIHSNIIFTFETKT